MIERRGTLQFQAGGVIVESAARPLEDEHRTKHKL